VPPDPHNSDFLRRREARLRCGLSTTARGSSPPDATAYRPEIGERHLLQAVAGTTVAGDLCGAKPHR
jgi:hypothetical protein